MSSLSPQPLDFTPRNPDDEDLRLVRSGLGRAGDVSAIYKINSDYLSGTKKKLFNVFKENQTILTVNDN